ncbi:hypothetical protein EDB87DRAFT_1691572 [Lactarius vividus]|nr:hypothetical protein EDB87DRAFT_1691572 [Lactarius vividus]
MVAHPSLLGFPHSWMSGNAGWSAKACDAHTVDFMVDIVGLPRSPWNIAAGRVFADHFIQKMGYNDTLEKRQEIERAFTRHQEPEVSSQAGGAPTNRKASEKSKHSWQQRKYQLFQRHHEIAKLFDPLTKHLGVLDTLGPDGMSSDESLVDPDTQQLMYTVAKPDWRHPGLHNWLKVLINYITKTMSTAGPDKRGAFPHIRAGSQKVHKKVHVPTCLPINAYDPKWLEG